MYSLLPEKYVKDLRKEYHLRLGTAYLFFLAAALCVGGVSLFPSYILSRGQETQANIELNTLKKASALGGADKVEQDALNTKGLIDTLHEHQDAQLLSEIADSVVSRRGNYVTISSIQVSRDSTSTAAISLSGVAPVRESLLAFKKSIEQDKRFTKVDLPVSDLAKSRDIHFSLKVRMKW